MDSGVYGDFSAKWLFSVYCQFFVRVGRGRSSSRRLRFAQPTLNAGQHAATGSATSAATRHSGRLRAMTTMVVLRNKAIKPLPAAAQPLRPTCGAHNPKSMDTY
jgi:hypothetical protein